MILDIVKTIKDKNGDVIEKALDYVPLVIDFDVKDNRDDIKELKKIKGGFDVDDMISDIKECVRDILSEYEIVDSYDKDLFNYLLSITEYDFNGEMKISNYSYDFDNLLTSIVQKKNKCCNFHIIYPFVIIDKDLKDEFFNEIKERLNEDDKYCDVNFKKIIDNSMKANDLRVINCSKGDRRCGKSVFVEFLGKILDNIYFSSSNGDIVKNEKSGIIFDNLLVVLEECTDDFNTAKETVERMKQYITSDRVDCRKLFKDSIKVVNRTSFILNTNDVKKIFFDGKDDARYVVFKISNEKKEDIKYFKPLCDAMDDVNVQRYFYWNVRNNNEYNYETKIQLMTDDKINAINKKFNTVYDKFITQFFLEKFKRNNNKCIVLKALFLLFKNRFMIRNNIKNITMREFNDEIRNMNIIEMKYDNHRNSKSFVIYDKVKDYVINKLRYVESEDKINVEDIEDIIYLDVEIDD